MPSPRHIAKTTGNESWRDRAACIGLPDPETMFPTPPRPLYSTRAEQRAARERRQEQERRAKAVCATCPVTTECLEYADNNDEREGVWGGMTTTERGKTPLR